MGDRARVRAQREAANRPLMSGPLVQPGAEPVDESVGGVRQRLAAAYERHIRGRPVEASSFATIAYFVTLVLVRVFTTATSGDRSGYISIAGLHIHHLVFGVIAILIAGVLALDEVFRLTRAVLFGIGAALVLDEFALLVFLKDVYWLPQGALSGFALAVGLLALAVNAWRGRPFIGDLVAHIRGRP